MSGQTEAGNDPQRMSWLDGGVGILVNPMSGRDVRRLAAHAANMTHEAKRDIVARIAAGAPMMASTWLFSRRLSSASKRSISTPTSTWVQP